MAKKSPPTNRQKIEKGRSVGKRQANQIIADGPKLQAAKLRKEQATAELRVAQAATAKLMLEKERAKLIPREQVEEEGIAIGTAIKAQLKAWVGALPGRLEGLTAGQMVPIFEDEVTRILRVMAGKC